jgi:hypothetical protein
MWFEPLPEQCPPADAISPNGKFYRLAETAVPKCADFWSHRRLWPTRKFNTPECLAMSVSLFADHSTIVALKMMKLHAHKSIVALNLNPDAGVVKKTFGPHHHSWWRKADFELFAHVVPV